MGTQRSSSMLGRAVSSSTPNDVQPNSHKGVERDPRISRQAMPAPPGMAYRMQRRCTRQSVCPVGRPARRGCSCCSAAEIVALSIRRSDAPIVIREVRDGVVVFTGTEALLDRLAAGLENLAATPASEGPVLRHIDVEYFPGHPFLAEESQWMTVMLLPVLAP